MHFGRKPFNRRLFYSCMTDWYFISLGREKSGYTMTDVCLTLLRPSFLATNRLQ